MLQKIVQALGVDPNKREVQKCTLVVEKINQLEAAYEALSDEALKAKTGEFKNRLEQGETLDDLLPEAFAAVREASKRTIGLRHFDVQMIGGMTLHHGKIAEMRTGEGKTLVATLPVYLNALAGRGAHLVTVNDYLARRDARWMAPIYQMLGMTVGVLQMASRTENGKKAFVVDLEKTSPHEDQNQLRLVDRVEAYRADITYGTNAEFGFDYLRDNLTMSLNDRVQRGHFFAIVDEVDNILIDEARTPLIISGPAQDEAENYLKMAQIVRQLRPEDYEVSEKDKSVSLTEVGEAHVEELVGMQLRDPERPEDITPEAARTLGYLEQALRGQFLFRRNKDYLVQAGKVVIIDEFTGRLMPGRRWSEGLHQAIEAKEGVKVEPENVTYATITLQNYFRMYEKLSGMTGTALTEAEEFSKIYKLDVLPIPTNLEFSAMRQDAALVEIETRDEENYKYKYYARRNDSARAPLYYRRKDYPDVVYRTEEGKLRAITTEILRYFCIGRPQLIGTTSVEHSERLSDRLSAEPMRRLMWVQALRDAWMAKNNSQGSERVIKELEFLNRPLLELNTSEMRRAGQGLDLITTNPDDPDFLARVCRILNLKPEEHGERLKKALQGGIPHQVLNARKHDEEGMIIARAGSYCGVTIATNMAGRGVDIKLGGELPDGILQDVIRVLSRSGVDPYAMNNEQMLAALKQVPEENYGIYEEAIRTFLRYMDEMEKVRALGGLHVIGSERHESRRIDNQLRGRAARQGDPGSSRFYLSLEDELMRLFGGDRAENLMNAFNIDPSLPIESSMLGRMVEQAQERVEGNNFDIRKHLLEYDDVLNTQRKRIYSQRDLVFTKDDLHDDVLDMLRIELKNRIPQALASEEGPWKLLAFMEEIQPTMIFEVEGMVIPSYTLVLTIAELRNEIKKSNLAKGLAVIAEQALDLDKKHLLTSASEMLEKTGENLETQRAERIDLLDTFFEGLKDRDENEIRRPQDILDELSAHVRIPLRLQGDLLRKLPEGDPDVKDALAEQINLSLANLNLNRATGAMKRRLGDSLNLPGGVTDGKDWDEVSDDILEATENFLEQRKQRLLSDQGPVGQNIAGIAERMENSELTDERLAEALYGIAQWRRTEVDTRTRNQIVRRINLLNYIHLASRSLANMRPETVTDEILEHEEAVREKLITLWGRIEWDRQVMQQITLQQLEPALQAKLAEAVGKEEFEGLKGRPLTEYDAESREAVSEVLGNHIQNIIYRQILLRSISELWVDYLTRVDALRVSIGLEAYAQRDPLVMYKGRASEMFGQLLADIRMGVIKRMFLTQPRRTTSAIQAAPAPAAAAPADSKAAGQGHSKKKKHHKH